MLDKNQVESVSNAKRKNPILLEALPPGRRTQLKCSPLLRITTSNIMHIICKRRDERSELCCLRNAPSALWNALCPLQNAFTLSQFYDPPYTVCQLLWLASGATHRRRLGKLLVAGDKRACITAWRSLAKGKCADKVLENPFCCQDNLLFIVSFSMALVELNYLNRPDKLVRYKIFFFQVKVCLLDLWTKKL